jgi:4-hydroxy-tetrahydrodipicolinate reductase
MGRRLIQLIAEYPSLALSAALVRGGDDRLGRDAGTEAGVPALGVLLADSAPAEDALDVMIDFSVPAAATAIGAWCHERRVPLLVGTTGLEAEPRRELEAAAADIPVLIAPNTSRAVNLLMKLVGEAARVLGSSADVDIIERHHRTKKDAPSGTALRLGEVAARGLAASNIQTGATARPGVRPEGEIGTHALRVADCPGEHQVVFSLLGETLELGHRAINRDGFARGALEAAKFLVAKAPGLYTMEDVLA